jgi:hypothetical protein
MPNRKRRIERRKYKRFRVPKNAFVLLRPHDSEVGQIIDISSKGLAFDYAGSEQLSSELSELDILITDNHFRLNKVPYKTVSNFETYESPSGSIRKRRCGVQFGGLTESQISQLKHFIQRYTSGETSD